MNQEQVITAQVAWVLADRQPRIVEHLMDEVIARLHPTWPECSDDRDVAISPSRIHGLLNAAAWHRERPTATQRLAFLEQELERLYQRAKGRPDEQALRGCSITLYRMIWTHPEKRQKDGAKRGEETLEDVALKETPFPLWNEIQGSLLWSGDDVARLQDEARLMLALSVFNMLSTLYETRLLQKQLKNQEGGWEWR